MTDAPTPVIFIHGLWLHPLSWTEWASMFAAAGYQAARVARARELPQAQVEALIAAHTEGRLLGVLGEQRVNVLELNLALDALK